MSLCILICHSNCHAPAYSRAACVAGCLSTPHDFAANRSFDVSAEMHGNRFTRISRDQSKRVIGWPMDRGGNKAKRCEHWQHHSETLHITTWRMAGAAGLEPVTSAVTGQRSNQLSYAPAMGAVKLRRCRGASSGFAELIKSGQQTPRRWGWGTPLKKRAATRMIQCYVFATFCQ